MSVHYNIFVGPYIQVYNPPLSRIEEYITCHNKKCKQYRKTLCSSFCPDCGNPTVKDTKKGFAARIPYTHYEVFPRYELDQVHPDYNGDVSDTDYLYFVDGGKYELGRSVESEGEACPIDLNAPSEEIAKLADLRSEEIKKLQNIFGEKNVQVLWGVLATVS